MRIDNKSKTGLILCQKVEKLLKKELSKIGMHISEKELIKLFNVLDLYFIVMKLLNEEFMSEKINQNVSPVCMLNLIHNS